MGAVFRKHPKQAQPVPSAQVHTEHPAQGFDPRHLSKDLVVWCRADAGVETNGSTVSKWRDMSGRGQDFSQATASSQPTPKKAGQGGHPEIVWDDDRMTGSSLFGMLSDPGEWLIFLVLGQGWSDPHGQGASNFSNSPGVLSANTAVGYAGICMLSADRGGFGGGIYNAGYKNTIPTDDGKISAGEPAIFALYSDSGGIKSRQNGEDGTAGTAADLLSTATTLQLGDVADNGRADEYYDGPLSEVMIFNGVLTQNEFSIVESYLSDRYGIRVGH